MYEKRLMTGHFCDDYMNIQNHSWKGDPPPPQKAHLKYWFAPPEPGGASRFFLLAPPPTGPIFEISFAPLPEHLGGGLPTMRTFSAQVVIFGYLGVYEMRSGCIWNNTSLISNSFLVKTGLGLGIQRQYSIDLKLLGTSLDLGFSIGYFDFWYIGILEGSFTVKQTTTRYLASIMNWIGSLPTNKLPPVSSLQYAPLQ